MKYFKWLLVVLFVGLSCMMFVKYNSLHKTIERKESDVLKLQKEVKKTKNVKQSVETVKTNYQKAIDATNKLVDLEQKLHDFKDNCADGYNQTFSQIDKLVSDDSQGNGPFVSFDIDNWKPEVKYGGQDALGNISMSILYKDGDTDMLLITMKYDPATGKFNSIKAYPTNEGIKVISEKAMG